MQKSNQNFSSATHYFIPFPGLLTFEQNFKHLNLNQGEQFYHTFLITSKFNAKFIIPNLFYLYKKHFILFIYFVCHDFYR